MILAMRTDRPEAELYLYEGDKELAAKRWVADRQLAETLLKVVTDLLAEQSKEFKDLTGLIVFSGPGSFTGLRIGAATVNALAYGLGIPVVGTAGDDWLAAGLGRLASGEDDRITIPTYGGEPNISTPKK